jgi:Uma2 family endonuclease
MENIVQEAAPKYNFISPKEYLEMERASDEKHEYFDGQVYAMSGASLRHNRISMNLAKTFGIFLEEKGCEMLASDMRVTSPSTNSYMYPDAVIVCGDIKMEDDKFDTMTNPSIIFEILSPSTRSIDKGRKFFYYQEIPSLKEYIMIDSLKAFVQIARRTEQNTWKFDEVYVGDGSVFIQTINYHLSLSDIYKGTGI